MDITDLATPNGTAIDLTEEGMTIEGTLQSIGDWRDIDGKFGTVTKAPFNLKVGDEDRTLWVKKNSRLATVLGQAFKEAGLTSIATGGVLKLRRVKDVDVNKGNSMHDFVAKYTPAAGTGPELEDFQPVVPQLVADMVDDSTGCWLWTRAMSDNGYGLIRRDGRLWKAHCWIYRQLVGPIPDGLDLDHLCRNRACVNPEHLEPVTRAENLRRGNGAAVSLVCKHGHWKLGDNLYVDPTTKRRFCLTCGRKFKRESIARRRAKALA